MKRVLSIITAVIMVLSAAVCFSSCSLDNSAGDAALETQANKLLTYLENDSQQLSSGFEFKSEGKMILCADGGNGEVIIQVDSGCITATKGKGLLAAADIDTTKIKTDVVYTITFTKQAGSKKYSFEMTKEDTGASEISGNEDVA